VITKIRLAALIAAAPIVTITAGASADETFEFTYAGTACKTFDITGMGQNGGAELVNWHGSNVIVSCPFVREAHWSQANAGNAYIDTRGSTGICNAWNDGICNPVNCVMWAMQPAGSGWMEGPSGVTTNSGYTTLNFNTLYTSNSINGAVMVCDMSPGSIITDYRVAQDWWSR
jgi:hypothetical protein